MSVDAATDEHASARESVARLGVETTRGSLDPLAEVVAELRAVIAELRAERDELRAEVKALRREAQGVADLDARRRARGE